MDTTPKVDDTQKLVLTSMPPVSLMILKAEDVEVLRVEYNGDFFVNGKLVENDKEVVEAFRTFLRTQGYDWV